MDKKINKIVQNFISTVALQNPNLVTSFLFGSYAMGKYNDDSDIDVALIIDKLSGEDKFDQQV